MMKKTFVILPVLSLVFLTISCNKKHTCTCTENYSGNSNSYSRVISEEEFTKKSTEEAKTACDKGDVGPQNVLTETWEIDCELK